VIKSKKEECVFNNSRIIIAKYDLLKSSLTVALKKYTTEFTTCM
jgi:hypothetical protein